MLHNGIRADSRGFMGTYGRKCGGMSTGAWGRRCHRHVHGRVAGQCAGIWDAPLALDARTWHMGCWHWTYGTWPREDVPGLGLTDEDVGLLRGWACDTPVQGLIGLIGYSYHQVATSFSEAGLQRTPRLSVLGPEKFGDGWPTGKLFPGAHKWGQSA